MQPSQLLILGNGFDLHCGLKSSYKDFFKSAVLDNIGKRFGLIQMKATAEAENFWINLLFQYYKEFKTYDYNWCDVEKIIKDTLLTFGNHNKGLAFDAFEKIKRRESINTASKPEHGPIQQFLNAFCMSIYYNAYRTGRIYSYDDAYSLLLNCILQELHKFEIIFCKYIKDNIVNPKNEKEINTQYIVNAINLLKTLTGFTNKQYSTIDDIIERENTQYQEQCSAIIKTARKEKHILSNEFNYLHSVNILSFNYTALFDILEVQSPCVYNNVHGKLCLNQCSEKCSSCNIIFGIDDTFIQSQDENFEIHKFSKTYRKMLYANIETRVLPAKDNMLEIKFYGHSLSEADYSYFQSIFDYYNIYENSKVSLMFYYSKGFEQTDEVYRLINNYGKTLSNKNQGRNLTHKLLLENRLKIIEIP